VEKDYKTIFAPATLVGESSITVTRISGKDTFNIVSRIFSLSSEAFKRIDFSKERTHSAHHGYIFDGREVEDEVVLTVFKSPNSYTGEDVAEISSHGGSYVFRKLSGLLLKYGAVFAEPGEFTKRAFLNGRLDLTQAEAVADLIRSKTGLSSRVAMHQLKGSLSTYINSLREDLVNYCSLVELELDFSEEDLEVVSKNVLLEHIDKIIRNIDNLTKSYESGKIIHDGVNLTIVGIPNVGKSSIFNYLLKESRAIVSEIPGTTRDYLREPLIMGGIVFNLVDTAGLRDSKDFIEKEGVKRTHVKLAESDIVLHVIDLTGTQLENNSVDLSGENKAHVLTVYNKCDLPPGRDERRLCVSALTGENMDSLQTAIVDIAKSLVRTDKNNEVIITNERHRDCLLKSCEYLVNCRKLILDSAGNELISFEIREAMSSLEEIIGKTTNVDILNNIFSKFCIGK
jgi:tRNA modification GTPase